MELALPIASDLVLHRIQVFLPHLSLISTLLPSSKDLSGGSHVHPIAMPLKQYL